MLILAECPINMHYFCVAFGTSISSQEDRKLGKAGFLQVCTKKGCALVTFRRTVATSVEIGTGATAAASSPTSVTSDQGSANSPEASARYA